MGCLLDDEDDADSGSHRDDDENQDVFPLFGTLLTFELVIP